MAQPLARDEQGNVWDISDPHNPKFVSHGASPLASPGLPYEAPQAAANLARTNVEVKNAEATSAATVSKTNAEAESAKIAAAQAEEQWKINHPEQGPTATMSGPAYIHYLQQTNPGRAAYIQGLAEGRVPFPSAQMMRSAAGQALLTDVMRADPSIDATNYTTRAAARKNAATGTLGQSDNALITAVGHAARLQTLVPDVFGSKATPFNSIANAVDAHLLGGKQPAYDQNAQLLGDEVASAYGTNSQGKQNEAGSQFSSSLATGQKLDNIHGAMDLLGSKLAANRAQFAYGNGQLSKPDFMLLPAQTRQELMQIAPDVANKYFAGVPSIDDAAVQAEVKARIARGEDPALTAQWLTSIGRPPNKDTTAALLANRGNQNPDVRPPQQGSYADSYMGQGMSGANEGLASVLGAPVDLMTGAMNLIPKGINAVANTNIPTISDPFAGSQSFKRGLSDIGSIFPSTNDPGKQFVRRVGESVGAAAVPGMFAGSLPKVGTALLSGVGGGIGGATAQAVAPNNPLAEMAGETFGGGLTGLGLAKAARGAAQSQIDAAVPTVEELKQQAANLYSKAEQRGVTAAPEQTQQLADGFRKTLLEEGQLGPKGGITNADTNTSKAYNLIQQYAGQEMTPKQMNTVRSVLADSRQSADPADRRLGGILLDRFDNFVSPLAPEFDQARSVASRYLQAQDLEKARELADARASQFTGSGFENALRTEYRGLDRNNIKGNNYFSPDVTAAIQTVARGTPTSNFFRGVGRLAPTGPVSAMGDVLPAIGLGAMTNPVAGGMFGAGLAGAGIAGRVAATRMGINAADQAELIARNGGTLSEAPLIPHDLRAFYAQLAAAQQAKYLSGN